MTAQHIYDVLIAQFDCIHGGHSQSLVQIKVQNLVCHQHQLSLPLQHQPYTLIFLFFSSSWTYRTSNSIHYNCDSCRI